MIESRIQADIFLEPLQLTKATINSTIHGSLNYDSNNNLLKDNISGARQILKVDGFTGNGIILYTSKTWTIITGEYDIEAKTGMENYYNSLIVPDSEPLEYKINAKIQTIDSFDGSSVALNTPFNINLYTPFKVILNNKEVTDYYAIDNVIGFNSGYRPFGNSLVVVYYRTSTPTSNHTCNLYFKQAIKTIPSWTDFELGTKLTGKVSRHSTNHFKVVGSGTNFLTSLKSDYTIKINNIIYTVAEVIDNTNILINTLLPPFSNQDIYITPAYKLLSVDTDYQLSNNSTFYERTIKGSKLGVRKFLSTKGNTQFTKWVELDDSLYADCGYPVMSNRTLNYINKDSNFRIILINRVTREMIILVNARLSDIVPLSVGTDKNAETLNIEFEKKVFLTNYGGIFGDANEVFGEGWFGGIKILKDGV